MSLHPASLPCPQYHIGFEEGLFIFQLKVSISASGPPGEAKDKTSIWLVWALRPSTEIGVNMQEHQKAV